MRAASIEIAREGRALANVPVPRGGAKKRRVKMMVLRPMWQIARLWPFGRRRVLVLEDDTMMQKLVAKLLRSLHVRVDIFGNGRDVVRKIAVEGDWYDALLLDLMMPHEGGLTVLQHLKAHHASLLSRVILMTGSGTAVTDPWSRLVFAVVHKPFDGSALVTTVSACFQQTESLVA